MSYKKNFYIHIDDFGFNKEINRQIVSHVKNCDFVKGISVFAHPNANYSFIHGLKKVNLSLHLNLTSFQKIKFSFFELVIISMFPLFFIKKIKIIDKMIKYQIDKFLKMKLNKKKI